MTSKTKVAPLKTQSIARLELCAALVGARLLKAVQESLKRLEIKMDVYAWTDSEIVLHWLNAYPGKWNTYVANRTSEIQEVLPRSMWYHIPTKQNPADCASRGQSVEEFMENHMWKYGPECIGEHQYFPPQPEQKLHFQEEEMKTKTIVAATTSKPPENKGLLVLIILQNYSCINRAVKVLTLVRKAVAKFKQKIHKSSSLFLHMEEERRISLKLITRAVQEEEFPEEIAILKSGKQLHKKSRIFPLYPWVDKSDGILKVGGRLAYVERIPEQTRFPAILPKNSWLSHLLALQVHSKTLHGGLHLCLSELRRSFWIISARTLMRFLIRKCVTCYRYNSRQINPLMGDLPKERILPSPPFTYVGLDFAGPFYTKGYKENEKTYACIFVCFSTKAVHIESVVSLSADHCAKALRRFCSRRGAPKALYSDNGTNFIGARKELLLIREQLEQTFPNLASEEGIMWNTIPPGSPHFGGLWEAAVKSMKLHMKKSIAKSVLTFEEFRTLMTEIESIMNSRPLTPVSDDPNDLRALTPNMLVMEKEVRTLPLPEQKTSRLIDGRFQPHERWNYVMGLATQFWKRWSKEYVTDLHRRNKWASETPELEIGDMVLVTDENHAPLEWDLGRVEKMFTGNDSVPRAILVKTKKGTYKRPATKLRKLPIYREDARSHRQDELMEMEEEPDPGDPESGHPKYPLKTIVLVYLGDHPPLF
jgi:transposase InsO family protein